MITEILQLLKSTIWDILDLDAEPSSIGVVEVSNKAQRVLAHLVAAQEQAGSKTPARSRLLLCDEWGELYITGGWEAYDAVEDQSTLKCGPGMLYGQPLSLFDTSIEPGAAVMVDLVHLGIVVSISTSYSPVQVELVDSEEFANFVLAYVSPGAMAWFYIPTAYAPAGGLGPHLHVHNLSETVATSIAIGQWEPN